MKPIAAISIAALATLGLVAPLKAQDATNLQMVKTSRALFDIGISNQDPLMILAAAKLRKQIPLSAIAKLLPALHRRPDPIPAQAMPSSE